MVALHFTADLALSALQFGGVLAEERLRLVAGQRVGKQVSACFTPLGRVNVLAIRTSQVVAFAVPEMQRLVTAETLALAWAYAFPAILMAAETQRERMVEVVMISAVHTLEI